MVAVMSSKAKNVPCEGCRERKKKCSSGLPCERCRRLGIECHYLKPAAPPDLEYVELVNSREMESQVFELETMLKSMENEMQKVHQSSAWLQQPITLLHSGKKAASALIERKASESNSSTSSIISDNASTSTDATPSSPTSPETPRPTSPQTLNQTLVTKHQLIPIKKDRLHYNDDPIRWHLRLGPYGLRIETDIKTIEELSRKVNQLADWNGPMLYKQPTNTDPHILPRYVLFSGMRQSQFRAIRQCIAAAEHNTAIIPTTYQNPNAALELLQAFFACQFYRVVGMHRGVFYSLFVDPSDPEASPAVSALCAAILTMRCRHVSRIIPPEAQVPLQRQFAQNARDNVNFDEPTIETLFTYIYLARYYVNLLRPEQAAKYFDLAVRIRYIVVDQYVEDGDVRRLRSNVCPKEWEFLKRMHWELYNISANLDFQQNKRGIPAKPRTAPPPPSISSVLRQTVPLNLLYATPQMDESERTVRSITKDKFGYLIHEKLHRYLKLTRNQPDSNIPLELLISTEKAINACYYKDLPESYRLPLNIFENGLTDEEFRERLAHQPTCDAVSVALAIQYHQALIALYETFLPPLPAAFRGKSFLLGGGNHAQQISDPKDIEKERSMHTMRALETCYRSAIIVVRLMEYGVCYLPDASCGIIMPCLVSAWDIHIRNACLGVVDPEQASAHVPSRVVRTSRDYILRCIQLLRKGYFYNAAERPMWEHHQAIENELLQAMFSTQPFTAFDPQEIPSAW
ncbi:hypothetical protein BCR43DRAFT_560815 [Syncephalastrum racemosum]|uniref:Zn(2)-C6 fungal-type domain-containing protein n=1 Tax=Syncephalastrum racemosum TaxID=13706 RepID=A0A1X2HLN3_SYNRA|nr:hypothetical protein BCR43DRAFT_560815 [Syncephalastrum racemosum]